MLTIEFHEESDRPAQLVIAAGEYRRLWKEDGGRIVRELEHATGLRFAEAHINAIIYEGVSQAHPLLLRASYPADVKRATLIHELCHRLIRGNRAGLGLPPYSPREQLENHVLIDLFLFDVWTDLYGSEFARQQVDVESERQPVYRQAWQQALALDRHERVARLRAQLRPITPDPQTA